MTTTPLASALTFSPDLSRHQKASGHSGYTDITDLLRELL